MKPVLFRLLILIPALLFSACNANKSQSTLLSDQSGCDIEDCPTVQDKIEGDITIAADQSSYQMNVDKSDVVEISGKCTDLGIRENYIRVQVYEGENTSISPYIDNDISYNCDNSLTSTMNGQRCFWVNQGRPLLDAGNPLREMPQCFNGRFGFSVRLGRILRTDETGGPGSIIDDALNPRKKYLVRYKLVATPKNEASRESQWNSTTVDRTVTKVSFNQTTTSSDFICRIKVDASKNLDSLLNIGYTGSLIREYQGGNVSVARNLYDVYPGLGSVLTYPVVADSSILNFNMVNMPTTPGIELPGYVIPGVKHKLTITAEDRKYDYSLVRFGGAIEKSLVSEEVQCGYFKAAVNRTGGTDNTVTCPGTGTEKTCTLSVSFPSTGGLGALEWAVVRDKPTWEENFEPTGGVHYSSGLLPPTSTTFSFRPNMYPGYACPGNGTYHVSVRYISLEGYKGAWADAMACPWSQ